MTIGGSFDHFVGGGRKHRGGEANPSAPIECPLIASAQNGRTIPQGLRCSTRSGARPYVKFDNRGTE